MEEVSEIEVIQMEDNATVAPAAETTTVSSTDAPQDSAVLHTTPVTPEVNAAPFDEEEVTFHKVFPYVWTVASFFYLAQYLECQSNDGFNATRP